MLLKLAGPWKRLSSSSLPPPPTDVLQGFFGLDTMSGPTVPTCRPASDRYSAIVLSGG